MQRLPVCVQKEPRLLLRLPRDVCCKQRRSLHVRQRLVHGQKRSQLIAIRLCQVPRVQACVQVYPSSNVQRWTHEAFFKTEILGTRVKAFGESRPSRGSVASNIDCMFPIQNIDCTGSWSWLRGPSLRVFARLQEFRRCFFGDCLEGKEECYAYVDPTTRKPIYSKAGFELCDVGVNHSSVALVRCSEGNSGTMCSQCKSDYFKGLPWEGQKCLECPSTGIGIFLYTFMPFFWVFLFFPGMRSCVHKHIH